MNITDLTYCLRNPAGIITRNDARMSMVAAADLIENQVADIKELREDLSAARTGYESAAEALRDADALRDKLVAALNLAEDALANSTPAMAHYSEAVKRHNDARFATTTALAAARAEQ